MSCKGCKYRTFACPHFMCMNPGHPNFYNSDFPNLIKDDKGCHLYEKIEFLTFRGVNYTYSWNWLDEDTFVLQFGDGELKDLEGDDCFILLEYHIKEDNFIIQSWYEEDNILIYSDYENSNVITSMFNLTDNEVMQIIHFAFKLM